MQGQDIHLSVDLVESARGHLRFLDHVASLQHVLTGDALLHGLRRYEQLWLPLCYQNRTLKLEPPIDIAWFWYLHLLQPLAYRRDCRKMFKDTLDHDFKDKQKFIPSLNNAIETWYSAYPKEGFNIIRNGEYVIPRRNKGQVRMDKSSKLSANLLALSDSQKHFCYQVALPHFRDRTYLQSALDRYKQFLFLKNLEPNEFLTPSVDILLMWYTHMCNPIAYANDMMRICGTVLDNNVKVKPGLADEKFMIARERTSELWQRVSRDEFLTPGSSFRSNERRKEMFPVTVDDLKESCVMTYKLRFVRAELVNAPGRTRRFTVNITCVLRNGDCQEITSLKGSKRSWRLSRPFLFNTVIHKEFCILLNGRNKLLCLIDNKRYAKGIINMRRCLESLGPMERVFNLDTDLDTDLGDDVKFELEGTVGETQAVLCDLVLQQQPFSKSVLQTAAVLTTLGLSGRSGYAGTEKYTCYQATHRFINHESKDIFNCKVLHVPEMVYSEVEIFLHNKRVALSRLIGSSLLPNYDQVSKTGKAMAFDPEIGERAMLLRNHNGDWAVCVAKWHVHSAESCEYLEVRFLKLAGGDGKVQRMEVRTADIEFQSFNANLYSGKVLINPSNNTVAENLALVWTISILYTLCSPAGINRTIATKTAAATEDNADTEDIQPKTVHVDERSCQFFIASGMENEVPSNAYLCNTFGSLRCDVHPSTQDITVEERKTDKRLLKKDSTVSLPESDTGAETPRKRKKKKRSSSNLKGARNFVEESPEIQNENEDMKCNGFTNSDVTAANTVQDDGTVPNVKIKKVKKRQSSKLEDMLQMSDDSITKEDVEEVRVYKGNKVKKRVVVHKISSPLSEEIKPPEDSLDEEEKEIKEFHTGQPEDKHLDIVQQELVLSKEQTTLIKDVVERKKKEQHLENEDGLAQVENDRVTFHLGDLY